MKIMTIYSVYIINKAGGLIYQYDHNIARPENEKTFSYPLELSLKTFDEKIVVAFGERDGIKATLCHSGEVDATMGETLTGDRLVYFVDKLLRMIMGGYVTVVGHTLLAVNGATVEGRLMADGRDVLGLLADETNYPVSIKFGRPKLTTNEKIMLASMFHSLFAIGSQLSPEPRSSGIEVMETDTFKLHCHQTMTGVKFIVMSDPRQAAVDALLRKLYEVYADFALKNPFYSLDMPIRCDLFDTNLQGAIEQAERLGISNV